MPHLRDMERFYKQTWYMHFKYVARGIAKKADELLVVAAWIGTKKRRKAMRIALEDVVDQSAWWCKSYQGGSEEVRTAGRPLVRPDQGQDSVGVQALRRGHHRLLLNERRPSAR
jgi:hypothetical protein